MCRHIRDFIQNLSNPEANQEPFKDPKANKNLMKFAQESFIQDDILWIRINKDEGTPRTVLFVPEVLRSGGPWPTSHWARRYRKIAEEYKRVILLAKHQRLRG